MATVGGDADDGVFVRGKLDPPDAIVEAAKAHLSNLQEEVFDRLQIDLTKEDPNAPHGRALAHLHWIAHGNPESAKGVCLALVYALVSLDWSARAGHYLEYLQFLLLVDSHKVVPRTLQAFARRLHEMHSACSQRLLVIVWDMAEVRWPACEQVLLALMREVYPGDLWPGAPAMLEGLLRLGLQCTGWIAADNEAACCSVVWALRWASALEEHQVIGDSATRAAELKRSALDLVGQLWVRASGPIMEAGLVLLFAMSPFREEPALAKLWQHLEGCHSSMPSAHLHACIDHLLPHEQHEQLLFLLDHPQHEDYYLEWFTSKHLATCSAAHLADVVLVALSSREGARPRVWRHLWRLTRARGGGGEDDPATPAAAAFVFAARGRGRARDALREALAAEAEPGGLEAALRGLAEGMLLADLALELEACLEY